MKIPKTIVNDARNVALMFGATYAVQISLLGTGQLTKHLIVAAATAAGSKVLAAEGPVVIQQIEADGEARKIMSRIELALTRDVIPALIAVDPVAGKAVAKEDAAIESLVPPASLAKDVAAQALAQAQGTLAPTGVQPAGVTAPDPIAAPFPANAPVPTSAPVPVSTSAPLLDGQTFTVAPAAEFQNPPVVEQVPPTTV